MFESDGELFSSLIFVMRSKVLLDKGHINHENEERNDQCIKQKYRNLKIINNLLFIFFWQEIYVSTICIDKNTMIWIRNKFLKKKEEVYKEDSSTNNR